jgi:hypothetical protein
MSLCSFSQDQSSGAQFFGQCMLDIESDEAIRQLEIEMRQNPYLRVVRLDLNTRRVFILTKALNSLTEAEFASWFNAYSDAIYCVQIGRHGVDAMKPFPFADCSK